jgi:predicted  nucleic acid-binding Zn-ribbon protein
MSEKQTITADDVGTLDASKLHSKPKASKTPELDKLLANLLAEKVEIESKAAPLREERKKLAEKIAPDLDKMRALDTEITAIERPRLTEINRQIAKIAPK